MPNLIILSTGGTIAGAGDSAIGAGYSSSQVTISDLMKEIPDISKIADIQSEQFSQIHGQNVDNKFWLELAKKINELVKKDDIDGIVITHGTDTLEETAYFLNLVIKSHKPVILVGSMRPSSSLSADGPLNLYNAIAVAANKEAKGKGVLAVFNDKIFCARNISKTYTTNVAAFQSNNSIPIGHVHYGKSRFYYSPTRKHTKDSIFDVSDLTDLPKVEILYSYSGKSPLTAKILVESGVDGIIYAGFGNGNISQNSLEIMSDAVKKGMILARSSRVGCGFVVPDAEINDSKYGFVTADNLNPQKARILLMLALTKSKDSKKIQELFWEY